MIRVVRMGYFWPSSRFISFHVILFVILSVNQMKIGVKLERSACIQWWPTMMTTCAMCSACWDYKSII